MVARTCLNVTLYVHYLFWYLHEQWRFWYCLLGCEPKFSDPTVRLGLSRSERVLTGDGALARLYEGLGVSQQMFSDLWVDLYPGFNSTKLLLWGFVKNKEHFQRGKCRLSAGRNYRCSCRRRARRPTSHFFENLVVGRMFVELNLEVTSNY